MSVTGDQMLTVAITLAVLDAGGDASALGLVLACRGIGLVLFLLFGGVWGDRLPRRAVLVTCYVTQALAVAALVFAHGALWLLGAMTLLAGVLEAFIRPAFNALLGAVLEEDQRVSGRALVAVALRTALIAGPGIAVAVSSLVGVQVSFGLVAALFAVTAVLFRRVREPEAVPVPRQTMVKDIGAGLAEIRSRPWVVAVMVFTTVELILVMAPTQVLLPVISRAATGGDAMYGTALVCFGAGGLAGGLLAMAWKPRHPLLMLMPFGLVPLGLLLFPGSPLLFGCYLLAGAGIELFAIHWDVALQREIPAGLLGRVSSVAWLTSFGLMPLGQALTGPVTGVIGAGPVLAAGAVTLLAVPPLLLRVRGMGTW